MPCKIEIEKNLTEKVENLSEEGLGKKLSIANNIANRVNKIFGVKVVEFMQSGDFIDRIIRIPTSLINEYYINELRIEEKEAIERSIKANEYINDEGDVVSRDDYNFYQLDESAQEIKPGVEELFEYNDSLQSFKDKLINIIGVDKVKELYAGTDVEFNSFIIDEVELGFDKDLIVTIKTDKGQRTAFNLRLDGFYQQLKISEGGKTVRGIYAPLSEKVTAIDFLINEFKKVSTDKLTGNLKFPSYNKQKEYYLAKDVNSLLQDIVKFTEDNDTKLLAEALLKIPNINNIPLTITKYTKELRGRIKDNPDALGTYSSAFPELITVIGNLPKTTFEVVFLHELIHGVTVNEYYKNEDFSEKINKLYNHALKFKDYKTSKGITLGKMYGMKNPREFMSEAMTNPDFIYELSKYYSPIQEKLKEKNIFQEFINLVVDLIKNKLEGKGKKYIEDNLGKTVLNTISNYAKISSKGIYSISKFEEKQIKPGVEELFESNPQLASAVYEAVGVDVFQLKEDVDVTNAFLTARQHEEAKRINSGEFDDTKLDLKTELQNIIDNSTNPLLVELAKSIQNKESLKTIKAYSTQKLFKTKEGFEPAAAYQAETQRLVLFLGNTARFENKEREYQYLLHELVHHFVDRELVLTNSKQAENIRQLFKYTKYQLTKAGKENLYGLTNFHEFVTEALTNPDFQKELKSLQVPDQFLTKSFSIFDYFLELISKVLGTNKSVLEAVVSQAADIFELQEYKKSLSITPQQKQQAISKFQEYVNVTGRQDIQGFKEFVEGTKVLESELPHSKRIDDVNKTLLLDIKSGIEKGGIEDFDPKEEYHLTVIGFPIGKKIKEASQEVQDKVKELIDNTNFTISLKPEKYKIKKTYKTGERESIIQLASVPEINNFYKKLSEILGEELPEPFPHITLATKGDKMGIGVTSKADFETLSPVLMSEKFVEEGKVEEPESEVEKYLATKTSEDISQEVQKPEPPKEETREKAITNVVNKLKDLLTRLGITLKEFEDIYVEQSSINALTKKLEDSSLTQKQRSDIENQINALKAKGVDKRAIALADIMNRTINISVDGRTEDLTEEVLHFIVDIIEQKYPTLYKELYDKVWSYEKYKEVKENYKDRYTTEEEFRKEAIAQVLNDYLLKPLESEVESEYQNEKTERFWDRIVNSLKNLFTKTANVDVSPFKIATERLLNSDFITAEDIQYLNKKGLFYSVKKTKSAEEIRDKLLKENSQIEIKPGKDNKPRYFKNGIEVAKRVSDVVKSYYDSVFRNSERKDTALNEQKREEGVEIHSIFQHTFAKYVSPKGDVLSTPIAPNEELKKLTEKYPNIAAKIDESVKEIIKANPDSYFLPEIKVSNGTKIGGTLDLVVISKKDGRTSIYDWKSKRGVTYDKKLKSYVEINQIPWWNVNGWRVQLSEYTKILKANGVSNFGEIRMIPVLTFEKKVGDKYVIDKVEIMSFERSMVDPKRKQLLPVIGEEEKSPYKTINAITEKIRAVINQNIQKIKADYRLKPDLEEENAALENMYTILLATDNISSALNSLKFIIQDAKQLVNKVYLEKEKINELSDAELYQRYKELQSVKAKLGVYQEYEGDTVKFRILNIAEDIFGKTTARITREYEELLNQFKKAPTKELEDALKSMRPSYEIAMSLIKINAEIDEVSPKLRDYSNDYFETYANRNGVSDIFSLDLGQSFFGKFMNNVMGLYSLNFKTAQLAKKVLMKANSIIRDKNKKATDSMYALRDKFLKGKTVYNIEETFKNLIYYDKKKNDYFLVPEISEEFSKKFYEIKEKFDKGYSSQGSLFLLTEEYTKIKEWLENNLEMDNWRKDFEEKKKKQLEKFEDVNKALKASDPLEYDAQLLIKQKQFDYFNDIFNSPKAWDSLKKFKYAKRAKWESSEYKKLTPIEKELHKKFTSIYARAQSIGYAEGFKNYYRIPFKARETKKLKESLNIKKALFSVEGDEEDQVYRSYSRVDPVTGEEIIEIPILMTNYLPAVEEGKRVKSLDLFQIYLEFEQNLNRFEEMSKVEDILLDVKRVEENKTREKEVNMFGKLTGKQPEKEKPYLLGINREDVLKKLVYHALYGIKYEKDIAEKIGRRKYVSVKKAFQWLNDYSTALFIQASLKITGGAFIASSVVAATATSKNVQGSKYLSSLIGRLNPKNMNRSYRKAFNHLVTQKEVEELNLQRTETLKRLALYGKEYLINHLKHVDTFIQDTVFDASLEKWFVIDNKIVNAETYISSLIPNQETMKYQEIKKKEAELYEKNKDKTLAKYLEKNTKDNVTNISKLDKDSVYAFEQALRMESKKIVGNMSEEDIFAMRTGFFGSILTKFKTWMPELYASFFGGVYWREEGQRFQAGRFTSFYKSIMDSIDTMDASGEEKSKIKMGTEYLMNALMFLFNTGAFTFGKNKDVVIKRLEKRYDNYVQELEELGVDKIPTRKEYIDLTLQEAMNARNFILSVTALYFLSNVLGVLSGDDDPEEHEYLVSFFDGIGLSLEPVDNEILLLVLQLANSFSVKSMKELQTYFSADSAFETFTKLSFPVLGAGAVLGKAGVEIAKMPIPYVEGEQKYIFDAIPIVRPALRGYIQYSDDEWLQEQLNVDREYRLKEREEE